MSRPIHDAKFDHQWVIDKGALPGEPLICSVTELRRRELAELTRQHDDEIPAEEHEGQSVNILDPDDLDY